jgi:hypothetical protein
MLLALACALGLAAPASAADPPRYRDYYDTFARGNAKIPGTDTRWVPQGLAYWPEQDALVISYYDGDKSKNSRLGIIDRASGAKRKILELPEKGHVGGLAMSQGYLWVASSGAVSRIAKAKLEGTADGGRLSTDSTYKLAATSFATMEGDDHLWVGKYEGDRGTPSKAYRYPLTGEEPATGPDKTVTIPSNVQGMAVFGDKVVLSRSGGMDEGMDADSTLEVRPAADPDSDQGRVITAPNMSEGVVFGKGELHVLYESGAAKYAGADYRVKTVHHGKTSDVLG